MPHLWEDVMSARWHEVLDLQWRLFRAVQARKVVSLAGLTEGLGLDSEQRFSMFRDIEEAISRATPIVVSSNVLGVWDAAWSQFQPQIFHRGDPFVDIGFALFPQPVKLLIDSKIPSATPSGIKAYVDDDQSAGVAPIRALLWFPGEAGICVFGFGLINEAKVNALQGFKLVDGTIIPPEKAPAYIAGMADAGFFPWAIMGFFGLRWERRDLQLFSRQLQAFWQLAKQVVHTREQPMRQQRRAAARAGVETEHVTVIRLRRTAAPHHYLGGTVDWRCQWVVRGHWRNQWYASTDEHRQIFIAPHVKGPDDKPLRISERVVEFVR